MPRADGGVLICVGWMGGPGLCPEQNGVVGCVPDGWGVQEGWCHVLCLGGVMSWVVYRTGGVMGCV